MINEFENMFNRLPTQDKNDFVEELYEFLHDVGFPCKEKIEQSSVVERLRRYETLYGELPHRKQGTQKMSDLLALINNEEF